MTSDTRNIGEAGDTGDTVHLLQRSRLGDASAFGELLDLHRARLRRMVAVRMDPRLRGRVDEDDVIQDTFVEATERLSDYLADPKMPFFLWLRFLAGQRLLLIHRHHFEVQGRDARREVQLPGDRHMDATSISIADALLAHHTSPTRAASREELRTRVERALSAMVDVDREVLLLRHFEHLSNDEAAFELGLQPSATSKRFLRALQRLKEALEGMPGGLEGLVE